jgi:hypothetical protein
MSSHHHFCLTCASACSFFPPGWLSFAAVNPRFASWEAFEAAVTFPEPQQASRQHYTRRRELYQACTALLLADRAAMAADGVLLAGGVLSEVQQIVQAALQAPPPAPPAAAAAPAAPRVVLAVHSHPQLLVVSHTGSPAGTPTAAAAAAAAAQASGYGSAHAAAGPGCSAAAAFYVPVAVPVAEPDEPFGPKVMFYGKPVCHQVRAAGVQCNQQLNPPNIQKNQGCESYLQVTTCDLWTAASQASCKSLRRSCQVVRLSGHAVHSLCCT